MESPEITHVGFARSALPPDDGELTETTDGALRQSPPLLIVLSSSTSSANGRLIVCDRKLTIGRSDADIVIADSALSRRHLEIEPRDGVWRARDLASKNGTTVNGSPISALDLRAGDQIRIGGTLLQFLHASAAPDRAGLQRALGGNGVALWEYDARMGELVFSEHADVALDLPPSTLARRPVPLTACVQASDVARVAAAFDAALTGAPIELELRLFPASSLERWVMLRGQLVDETNGPAMVAGTVFNMTAAKRRELTLARTALIFESVSDGVVLTDDDAVIIDLNSAMASIVGVGRRETRDRSLFAVVPVPEPGNRAAEIRAAIERAGRWNGVFHLDGDAVFEVLVFRLRTDCDESAGLAWVFRDVTERLRAERRMAFLDRLASLGTMSAGVAHEINNPLAFVLANAEYIREQKPAGDVAEAAREIVEGAQRISTIVRDLKVFARSEPATERGPTDVSRAVEVAAKMTRSMVGSAVPIETVCETSRVASALEAQLVQVLVNVMVNAVQSYPEGYVGRRTVRVAVRDERGGVSIAISDTGSGMSAETAARAFEPFFTTKPVGTGTGLGLSICHGLVTEMGGSITLESTLGVGTTARIWLHADDARIARKRKATEDASPVLRVLVVDDEPLVRRAMTRVLARHQVVTSDCYTSACQRLLADHENYDVVLCDLMMPDGTGMDLYARIAAERPELAPRFVFFTGAACTEASREFLQTTKNPQLLKPVDAQTLRRVLVETARNADTLAEVA